MLGAFLLYNRLSLILGYITVIYVHGFSGSRIWVEQRRQGRFSPWLKFLLYEAYGLGWEISGWTLEACHSDRSRVKMSVCVSPCKISSQHVLRLKPLKGKMGVEGKEGKDIDGERRERTEH